MNDLLKIIIKCVEKSKQRGYFSTENIYDVDGTLKGKWMDVIDADLFIEALKNEITEV